MWETKELTITLQLPHDIADQAEEVQKADPEFLSRVVLYGLTRLSIYRSLRDRNQKGPATGPPSMGPTSDDGVQPIPKEEQRAILAENRQHDGEYSEERREELERIQRRSGLPVQRRPVR